MKHTATIACILGAALAAGGCASSRSAHRTDPAVATAASAARLAFAEGNPGRAMPLYRRALVRARAMDDGTEIANNAYNLAACMVALGSYEAASPLLREANRAAVRTGSNRADILLMEARVAWLSSRSEEARDLLEACLSLSTHPHERILADLLYAEMACDAGRLDEADVRLRIAKRALPSDEPMLEAAVAGMAGRISELRNRPETAAGFFDVQAMHLRAAGRYREMAETLGRAGRLYGSAEQWPRSWDRSYRAARSLFAQGDVNGALHQVEQALTAAEQVDEESCRLATAALVKDIQTAVGRKAKEADDGTEE